MRSIFGSLSCVHQIRLTVNMSLSRLTILARLLSLRVFYLMDRYILKSPRCVYCLFSTSIPLHIRMKSPIPKLTLVCNYSFQAFAGLAVYSATKFFVEALTQSLRLETVGSGVKVTSIQPGMSTVQSLYNGHLRTKGKWPSGG